MRITIEGQTIRAVNLTTAPGRAVMALQQQTGYGLEEIAAMGEDTARQTECNKMIEFLSEHNRGRFVTWDEVLDRPLPAMIPDKDEIARAEAAEAEAEGGADGEGPTPASTDSPSVDADLADEPAPAKPARTRKSSSSTKTSRGSTSKSRAASSQ
ncbi:hypothetical protein APR04_003804 [Promicromonospora umidemergens]|uniref:Lsr2 protein n=1 Tax=Promicromonospora umidemergens TaxID=629679 RepID=A0ABP8XG80_9MICO|nr:hypothetical protein [Promicromonospora umidemergens]MCP2284881.1 hypothetical protein [Promicromonospora umidemergens]